MRDDKAGGSGDTLKLVFFAYFTFQSKKVRRFDTSLG